MGRSWLNNNTGIHNVYKNPNLKTDYKKLDHWPLELTKKSLRITAENTSPTRKHCYLRASLQLCYTQQTVSPEI